MPEETAAATPPAPTGRKPLWKREKSLYALLAIVLPIVNEKAGLDLSLDSIILILSVLGGLFGFEVAADLVKIHHEHRAKHAAANGNGATE